MTILKQGHFFPLKKNVKGIVIPSEETRISMYPFGFRRVFYGLSINPKPTI